MAKNVPDNLGGDHEVEINYINKSKKDRLEDQLDKSKKEQRVSTDPSNRAFEKRRDTDDVENLTVGLEDIDRNIMFQLKERFNFEIKQSGEIKRVPVIWDSPEDWAWAQKQAQEENLTSLQDRIIYPLIIVNRSSVQRWSNLDGQNTRLNMTPKPGVYSGVRTRSSQNRFDNFDALKDRDPVETKYVVQVPKYLQVSYDISLYTEQIQQMNKLIERISYYSQEYWGDPEDYLFYTSVDSINPETENAQDDSRYVTANFSAEVNGYIIPEDMTYEATTKKLHSVAKVTFEESTLTKDQMQDRINSNSRRS